MPILTRIDRIRAAGVSALLLAAGTTQAIAGSLPDPDGRPGFGVDEPRILLRYAEFDPADFGPGVPEVLRSRADGGAYIVQLHSVSTPEAVAALRAAGAQVGRFLPENAYIVRMSAADADAVRGLDAVRWVGPYHPAYKLDEPLLQAIVLGQGEDSPSRYSIQLLERGPNLQGVVAERIRELGGTLHGAEPEGFRIEATLTLDQLAQVAHRPEVLFIDAKGAPEDDMDTVRLFSGGDLLHGLGFKGEGVRGEVLDGGLRLEHMDFQERPPILHGPNSPITGHGTAVYGILFGDGSGDARYTGMLPAGQGIFASYTELGLLGGEATRYRHTAELVDETGPYRAVFQSNSWGDPRTTEYTTISAQMDDIIYLHDILVTQSQSNSGDRPSRPQAWAKNIVSVGGIDHYQTLTRQDDAHFAASTGYASDGRFKPDLSHFYDSIETTSSAGPREYTIFNGTSASTPIVAGHFGIMFQLWGQGVLGNDVDLSGSIFDNRPSAMAAKALMINTARPWTISDDISRRQQGWGAPDVWNLYSARNELFVVDQSRPLLLAGDRAQYSVRMGSLREPLRITMAYLDPAGNPASTVHRINDLDLLVTSPSGDVYRGNVGLRQSLFSRPGGPPNRVDTVENVFIESAEPGAWTIEVVAREINEDGNPATPGADAHFALVIKGGQTTSLCRVDFDGDGRLTVFDLIAFQRAFVDGDLRADFDGDGVLSLFDYLLFQVAFDTGCD